VRLVLIGLILAGFTSTAAWAQAPPDVGTRLLQNPAVKAALEIVKKNEPRIIEDQVQLTEVEAPPFKEMKRAELLKKKFEEIGLKNVRIDKAGNVLGDRPGQAPRPRLVMAAHLDTVFPEGTNVKTTREGGVIKAPGIGDDDRGLAVLLGVARALDEAKIQTTGSITFVGDVGEEGLGDLRGMKELFGVTMKGEIDRFVSIEPGGTGITNAGVGSHRYKVTFKGPGGHSYGAFGLVNPIHALGRAVAEIADFQVPKDPKTTFCVGRIGGGTSVNSIAYEAWLEMDMRSETEASLMEVDGKFKKALENAVAAENAKWKNGTVTVTTELVGDRPAGQTSESSMIVQTAMSVTRALGFKTSLGASSTDSNWPISLGIPAITVGGGGGEAGGGSHSLNEAFDSTNSWQGTQRAVLLAIALTEK
jgi:tripeptide aminopeptidase